MNPAPANALLLRLLPDSDFAPQMILQDIPWNGPFRQEADFDMTSEGANHCLMSPAKLEVDVYLRFPFAKGDPRIDCEAPSILFGRPVT